MFGQDMFTNGAENKLARRLKAVSDTGVQNLARVDKHQIYRARMHDTMHAVYEKATRSYNLKSREITYAPGQEIYKRNFILSDFAKGRNAKFCHKYAKCRVVRAVGSSIYELETLQGVPLGIFHAKDLKQ
ncbi:uncharacterized protein LOC135439771 [Drosophila montana]|uniref:uncharacterized protein LOC135439771 n=1 Tax=Drosophila montana TaxID=40370 RepID=UPI00313F00D1